MLKLIVLVLAATVGVAAAPIVLNGWGGAGYSAPSDGACEVRFWGSDGTTSVSAWWGFYAGILCHPGWGVASPLLRNSSGWATIQTPEETFSTDTFGFQLGDDGYLALYRTSDYRAEPAIRVNLQGYLSVDSIVKQGVEETRHYTILSTPEPASLVLTGAGLLALTARTIRRRARLLPSGPRSR